MSTASLPKDFLFTKEHEWLKKEGGKKFRVGITDYAQAELGDVVFVDLPEVGKALTKGQSFASVESVKAVSDVYAPLDGKILEVNSALSDQPQLLNESAYTDGWMIVVEANSEPNEKELMDAASYQNFLSEIAK